MQSETDGLRKQAREQLLADLSTGEVLDRSSVSAAVAEVAPLLDRVTFDRLVTDVLADVHGMGPLEPLLHDDAITDVMAVGGRGVWVERGGRVIDTGLLIAADEIAHLIERIVAPLGLRIDRASPMVDARLPDGSRVNAVLPPLAVEGPVLTIRRFGARPVPLDRIGAPAVAELLHQAVVARQNVLVSGGTGAGKTTLLNALARYIGASERVITIEDAAELRLPLRHVVRLEGRPANSEGVGHVTIRELVRNALRMRPDRIIVGEVRGPEALDMLQAMNTGHEGSMSTCHANSTFDALTRLETMVLMSDVALPIDAVRQQIAASIDLVVQIVRAPSGERYVSEIAEVQMDGGLLAVRALTTRDRVIAGPRRPLRAEPAL